jgi:ATP-dependent Clp protease ATP-binding subunit ClpC
VATTERSESELASLKRVASELAAGRKERPTTVHLLAAVAGRAGVASRLLVDRGLDKEGLLKAGRSFDEEIPDALERALAHARDVAKRSRGAVSTDGTDRRQPSISPDSKLLLLEASSLHLLVALLGERRFAAFRALALSGVDAVRLRSSALTLAMGVVPARREVVRAELAPRPALPPARSPAPAPARSSAPPLAPPAGRAHRRSAAATRAAARDHASGEEHAAPASGVAPEARARGHCEAGLDGAPGLVSAQRRACVEPTGRARGPTERRPARREARPGYRAAHRRDRARASALGAPARRRA